MLERFSPKAVVEKHLLPLLQRASGQELGPPESLMSSFMSVPARSSCPARFRTVAVSAAGLSILNFLDLVLQCQYSCLSAQGRQTKLRRNFVEDSLIRPAPHTFSSRLLQDSS